MAAVERQPQALGRPVHVQRAGQAQVEHNFINQILAIDKQADVVVVGDLNDYQFSPA
jgi:uncharacterized protein